MKDIDVNPIEENRCPWALLNDQRHQIAKLEKEKREAVKVLQNYDKLWKERDQARAALEIIATPMRPDGTYNHSRESCEIIAREALK